MYNLLALEFRKLKRTFLPVLLPLTFLLPIVIVLLQYGASPKNTIAFIVAKYSAIFQLISFAYVVILGCYIITMEYKNNMHPYLAVTPNSMKQILLCKYVVLLIETAVLQLAIFIALIIISTILSGFDSHIAAQYLTAGILSSIFFFCITPAVTYIALWRRSFASSALIFLILLMLTFPFSFMNYGYLFPHMLPILLVSEFLGYNRYAQIGYGIGIVILLATFALFFTLSVRKIGKKE